jgi:hypothetical protein
LQPKYIHILKPDGFPNQINICPAGNSLSTGVGYTTQASSIVLRTPGLRFGSMELCRQDRPELARFRITKNGSGRKGPAKEGGVRPITVEHLIFFKCLLLASYMSVYLISCLV